MKEEEEKESGADGAEEEQGLDTALFEVIKSLKKGAVLPVRALNIKEGETSPPKRYNSGSIILAMENAGQLIEDENCGLRSRAVESERVRLVQKS